MTERQVLLIKSGWAYVITNRKGAAEIFYSKLFEIAPHLRSLFKDNLREQAGKLTSMLTYVVSRLEKLESIEGELKALGARHVGYSVKPEHFAVVGEALLLTLEEALEEEWTMEVKEAWIAAYGALSNAMIAAIAEVTD